MPRKLRKYARNILHVRWVSRWKFRKKAQVSKDEVRKGGKKDKPSKLALARAACSAGNHTAVAEGKEGMVRVIRLRMTFRGYKDSVSNDMETYSGTSSRTSQRVVTSEAAARGWAMAALDIRKAF